MNPIDGQYINYARFSRAVGLDDLSIVPGDSTVNPMEVDTSVQFESGNGPNLRLGIPMLSSPMDGVTDVRFATEFNRLGGLGVMNLLGLQTRYESPGEVIESIIRCPDHEMHSLLRKVYAQPVKESLISQRIGELKSNGVRAGVSVTPEKAFRFASIAEEAGADLIVIQTSVFPSDHCSSQYESFDLKKFCESFPVPVIAGNVAGTDASRKILECGVSGILAGVGCGVSSPEYRKLGISVPLPTSILNVCRARDEFEFQTGRHVVVIADGGLRNSGDVCKALACGADAVMLGTLLAHATESAGKGCHWGLAGAFSDLPRGSRVVTGLKGSLKSVLYGPATSDDGLQDIVGAITACMGHTGSRNLRDLHKARLIFRQPNAGLGG